MKKYFFIWIISGFIVIACNNDKTNSFRDKTENTEGNKDENNKDSDERISIKGLSRLWKPVNIE